jgi:hypothetical protein
MTTQLYLMNAKSLDCPVLDVSLLLVKISKLSLMKWHFTLGVFLFLLTSFGVQGQVSCQYRAGPLNVQVHVKLGGEGVSQEQLQELVAWTERHSPVGDAISRAVPLKISVEVV